MLLQKQQQLKYGRKCIAVMLHGHPPGCMEGSAQLNLSFLSSSLCHGSPQACYILLFSHCHKLSAMIIGQSLQIRDCLSLSVLSVKDISALDARGSGV